MSNHAFFVYLARINIVNSVAKIGNFPIPTKEIRLFSIFNEKIFKIWQI